MRIFSYSIDFEKLLLLLFTLLLNLHQGANKVTNLGFGHGLCLRLKHVTHFRGVHFAVSVYSGGLQRI